MTVNRFYDTGPGPKKGEKGYCSIMLPLALALLPVALLRALYAPVKRSVLTPGEAALLGVAMAVFACLVWGL